MGEIIINNRFEIIIQFILPYIDILLLKNFIILSKNNYKEIFDFLKWKMKERIRNKNILKYPKFIRSNTNTLNLMENREVIMKSTLLNYYSILKDRCCICLKKCFHYDRVWNINIHERCLRRNLKNITFYPNLKLNSLALKEYEDYDHINKKFYKYYAAWEKKNKFIQDQFTIEYFLESYEIIMDD